MKPQKAYLTQERNHYVGTCFSYQGRQSLLFELKPVEEEVGQRVFPGEVESARGQQSDHLFSFDCDICNEECDESLLDDGDDCGKDMN